MIRKREHRDRKCAEIVVSTQNMGRHGESNLRHQLHLIPRSDRRDAGPPRPPPDRSPQDRARHRRLQNLKILTSAKQSEAKARMKAHRINLIEDHTMMGVLTRRDNCIKEEAIEKLFQVNTTSLLVRSNIRQLDLIQAFVHGYIEHNGAERSGGHQLVHAQHHQTPKEPAQ